MREIKFRCWSVTDKAMYYNIQKAYDMLSGTVTLENGEDAEDCYLTSFGQTLDYPDDYKVMQYTGLKDKNGKEIYEGDIVAPPMRNNVPEEVVYTNLGYSMPMSFIVSDEFGETLDCQVIGNIHEQPELITH